MPGFCPSNGEVSCNVTATMFFCCFGEPPVTKSAVFNVAEIRSRERVIFIAWLFPVIRLIASIRRSRVVTRYFTSQKAKRSFFYLLIQHVRYVYKVGSILPRFLNVPKNYKTKLIARLVLRQKGKIYWPIKEYKPKRIQARKLLSHESFMWSPKKKICTRRAEKP